MHGSRRVFLQQSAAMAGASLLPLSLPALFPRLAYGQQKQILTQAQIAQFQEALTPLVAQALSVGTQAEAAPILSSMATQVRSLNSIFIANGLDVPFKEAISSLDPSSFTTETVTSCLSAVVSQAWPVL